MVQATRFTFVVGLFAPEFRLRITTNSLFYNTELHRPTQETHKNLPSYVRAIDPEVRDNFKLSLLDVEDSD